MDEPADAHLRARRAGVESGTMLARLILALLVALLPLPASAAGAACHTSTMAAASAANHGHMPKPAHAQQSASDELCLGCVAPSTLHGPLLDEPLGHARALQKPHALTGATLVAAPPATPPPRSEV
ncbi:MAG: hypothetical protein J7500_01195 [Sphingomonas sp.]|uniref:hypothetical protein n=1 Tax=Sphingomonas sp. TaxID=28214 RepID=UPI001B26C3A5|nr:hypothetical protein [Sphingomonas sp.]MBO9621303.1 hypothetical protein [Sphingomonas sp.]